ncbi:Diphosphomevalonate decarboxylase [Giardia muris]|uniref:Diphosphomevalonate decarboxylase n=1 Tax=Giardia muris TaxID=5742 RepID=A0A4Z1SWZ4_GIAMU|nr:Diphosphomevalonate decarboxylase [Giardia muris]|eukprot:TNJ30264.1 Diphosphomevalonate decarboxylase [Giardia muris]
MSIASPNIALIKYWCKGTEGTNAPAAGSVSFLIDPKSLWTETRAELATDEKTRFWINGIEREVPEAYWRLSSAFPCLTRCPIHIHTTNNFPIGCGLASSASGAAALVLELDRLFSTHLSRRELSAAARVYSGSGARSIIMGVAEMIYDPNLPIEERWHAIPLEVHESLQSLKCLVVLFSSTEKTIGSTEAMNLCSGTTAMNARLKRIPERLKRCREALRIGDFNELAAVATEDWRCMHSVIQDVIGLSYITEAGWELAERIDARRKAGAQIFITFDAGPNGVILGSAEALREVYSLPIGNKLIFQCEVRLK